MDANKLYTVILKAKTLNQIHLKWTNKLFKLLNQNILLRSN
jgi:hypothetical protein